MANRKRGTGEMTDFEKKVIEVLSEKPYILTEFGEITTDKRYIIDKNTNTRYVLSRKTNTLILAIGDSKEELEEAYKEYRKKIDDIKRKLNGDFLCSLQCRECNSFMRVACYEMIRPQKN
jgi:hypothetical protein